MDNEFYEYKFYDCDEPTQGAAGLKTSVPSATSNTSGLNIVYLDSGKSKKKSRRDSGSEGSDASRGADRPLSHGTTSGRSSQDASGRYGQDDPQFITRHAAPRVYYEEAPDLDVRVPHDRAQYVISHRSTREGARHSPRETDDVASRGAYNNRSSGGRGQGRGRGQRGDRGGGRGFTRRGRDFRGADDRGETPGSGGVAESRPRGGRGGGYRGGPDRGAPSYSGGPVRGAPSYRGGPDRGASSYREEGPGMRRFQSSESLQDQEGAARNPGRLGPERIRIMGYRKLKELSESNDVRDICLQLTASRSGFDNLLEKDIQPDWMKLLLLVIDKVITSTQREAVARILQKLALDSKFVSTLNIFLGKWMLIQNDYGQPETLNYVRIILKFVQETITKFQASAEKLLPVVLMLKGIIPCLGITALDASILLDVEALFEECSTTTKKAGALAAPRAKRPGPNLDTEAPPDDFKEIPIFPRLKDLTFNEKPFLRANKVQGAYDSVDHYLDVQFRLLREDYIQPLRNGIRDYKKALSKGEKMDRLSDLRLYRDVRLISSVCKDGIEHKLQFDVSTFRKVRWQSSKRLLFGSLVCLSHDDFETMAFATVTNRDPKDLEKGVIQVRFETGIYEVSNSGASFLMAETTAYFEAYRHVLEGLLEIGPDFPFKRYIVECQSKVNPPGYLLKGGVMPHFNLSCLARDRLRPMPTLVRVPILNTLKWPKPEDLAFDDSQYQAVQTAMTKELAIIQGPPGTGKTYVGLKIVEALLDNRECWVQNAESDPILVVCFTNHALDQFLEGIQVYCQEGIVRVGGRSSSEQLAKYNLRNLRAESRQNKKMRRVIHENYVDCRKQLSELKKDIEDVAARIDVSTKCILPEKTLHDYMDEYHFHTLTGGEETLGQNKNKSVMEEWLGLTSGEDFPYGVTAMVQEGGDMPRKITSLILKPSPMKIDTYYSPRSMHDLPYRERAQLYRGWIAAMKLMRSEDDDETILAATIAESKRDILPDSMLEPYIKIDLYLAIKTTGPNVFHDEWSIKRWLGLPTTLQYDPLELDEVLDDLEEESDSEDNFVDAEEDAEIIQKQRALDDEDDSFTMGGGGKSKFQLHKVMRDLGVREVKDLQPGMAGAEAAGWQMQPQQKKQLKRKVATLLRSSDRMSAEEANNVGNVWDMGVEQRHHLYRYWLHCFQQGTRESVRQKEDTYTQVARRLREVLSEEDQDIIRTAIVIGMTTTGAAKYRTVLQAIGPRIIVVEEAAEVLESHIVTTLNKNCQHLILIGDHQQLRPTPTVYDLAQRFHLEISLFERLVKNNMHHVTLALQHRMRPDISSLVKHIYPNLRDHPSVLAYGKVLGLDKDMFFLHHEYEEDVLEENRSRSNKFEAEFLVALCRHLILQGYSTTQITILAAYTGQVFLIRKLMTDSKQFFHGVKITAVDNFQGEENDIILLSLVRSNQESSVGFLSIDNRVCVALSRAKQALYATGNFKLLASKSELWKKIVADLEKKQLIGTSLTVRCENHRDHVFLASAAADFQRAPEGGCKELCNVRLPCGHVCERICHVTDKDHVKYRCRKPCGKKCTAGLHDCKKGCTAECGDCKVSVEKEIPMCGHRDMVPCHKDPHAWRCTKPCKHALPCGHACGKPCGDCRIQGQHAKDCNVVLDRIWPCGHEVQAACHLTPETLPCDQLCKEVLNCGHPCTGSCGECLGGRVHKSCSSKCKKTLPCGHECSEPCSAECGPCKKHCPVKCSHSSCKDPCGADCKSCREQCQWSCDHYKCSRQCGEPCDRAKCNVACRNSMDKCKHPCASLCGETCFCLECHKTKVCWSIDPARHVTAEQKNEALLRLPTCGHIFRVSDLDNFMSGPLETAACLKICPRPNCGKAITFCHRYGNTIKKQLIEFEDKKKEIRYKMTMGVASSSSLLNELNRSILTGLEKGNLMHALTSASLTMNGVTCVRCQIAFGVPLVEVESLLSGGGALASYRAAKQLGDVLRESQQLKRHLMKPRSSMSRQELMEYEAATRRVLYRLRVEFLAIKVAGTDESLELELDQARAILSRDMYLSYLTQKTLDSILDSVVRRLQRDVSMSSTLATFQSLPDPRKIS